MFEAVPNVTGGHNVLLMDGLADVIRSGCRRGSLIDGSSAALVDMHRDLDHDRCVFTVIGSGEALAVALSDLADACVRRVNIHQGRGVHPRMGAIDVMPIIPLSSTHIPDLEGAFALANRIGRKIGAELGVPVVRYGLDEYGAPIKGASSTGEVRRGGLEQVISRVESGDLHLIAGPPVPHKTAGITLCGVREILVAFNVVLKTNDVDVARNIARKIRASSSLQTSLTAVKALGFYLPTSGQAQVSTNIESPLSLGPDQVLSSIAIAANEHEVELQHAELVGLAPEVLIKPLRRRCDQLKIDLFCAKDPSLENAIERSRKGLSI